MEQTLVNIGRVNEHWKRWIVVWLVLVTVVTVLTEFGFLGTLTGTAGIFFVIHGIQALWRSVSSRSVERTAIGSLAGRRQAVQIVGRAGVDDEPLTAPLTDTDCVAYRIQVLENKPDRAGDAG